ncbi:MAG: hypothetical protein AAF654_00570 [Myxococcota bacterium]
MRRGPELSLFLASLFPLALVVMSLASLRWVPDCGGVAYGFPLPFRQTVISSSLRFRYFLWPFVCDLVVASLVLVAVGIPVIRVLRILHAGLPLIAGALTLVLSFGLSLLCLAEMTTLGDFFWSPNDLFVFEWREVSVYLGWPTWEHHLEAQCN